MESNYSVLMAVYIKEKPEFLKSSMESMFAQTVPPNDFVLVCDGPLNEELDMVIEQMQSEFGDILQVIRLEKNVGLGNALNEGMKHCKNELIARMDSDDISYRDRCERELAVFNNYSEICIVSGTVLEFRESIHFIIGKRELPEFHKDICRFSHKRNPFNHPAIMFRKSAVEKAGGYSEKYPLFEDYYLWIRMFHNRCIGYNLKQPVLYMRFSTDGCFRRGGKKYLCDMLAFHRWLLSSGWTSWIEYITGALPHAVVCILPNEIRKKIYSLIHSYKI